jgi:succinyl-diaminopimelate desuccinylase
MSEMKRRVLAEIERDRDAIVAFIRAFVRCRSPNPPGDTRDAAAHVIACLVENGLPYQVIAPHPEMPNIVASHELGGAGRHLVLNGHMDVFPVTREDQWAHDPWGGELHDGKVYGRGVADMKVGTAAAVLGYRYLVRFARHLRGRLTLVAVSDEETFGPWGARYLFEHHRDQIGGDCVLIGEPTSAHTVRFGEKGALWLRFSVRTAGAHGAYTHASENAALIANQVITEMLRLEEVEAPEDSNLRFALDAARAAIDRAYGAGASRNVRRITVNLGTMKAGAKVNIVASECTFEVDFRIPSGLSDQVVEDHVIRLRDAFPQLTHERILYNPPSWSPPDTAMLEIVKRNAHAICGIEPVPVISLAGTDARLWRYHGIPAVVYGPAPNGMASYDEHVSVEEAINVVKCHVASAWDYLSPGDS